MAWLIGRHLKIDAEGTKIRSLPPTLGTGTRPPYDASVLDAHQKVDPPLSVWLAEGRAAAVRVCSFEYPAGYAKRGIAAAQSA
ncbi:hypothetical protein GCM10010449_38640 [Streptomyces rectiviolaceus]|uniref:Uncharacterized protein n=1 Tax=Streptomyces rectiviolaceus TaxID=332591 RepID=A0ABP6MGI4_9ACTN